MSSSENFLKSKGWIIGHVVHMDAAFPNDVFVGGVKDGSTSALYRGTRGGGGTITWSALGITAGTTSVTRLARLPDGRMFAAVQEGSSNRFYRSDATVSSWTNITASVVGGGSPNGAVGMCHVLRDGATVVLGWIGGPTKKSTDGGTTWTTVPLAITAPRPPAMLTTETSPSWSRGSLHQDPLDPNRWYLPNGFGPYMTSDGGATVSYMSIRSNNHRRRFDLVAGECGWSDRHWPTGGQRDCQRLRGPGQRQ